MPKYHKTVVPKKKLAPELKVLNKHDKVSRIKFVLEVIDEYENLQKNIKKVIDRQISKYKNEKHKLVKS